jgi:tRNA(Ile)-lysidine synthase
MDLSAHVAEFLNRHGLEHSTGILAVSGGPDSVALAHLCFELLKQSKIGQLIIAHVNHQLRGAESDADEQFVQLLAQVAGLSCKTTRIDAAAIAKNEGDNLESIARRERYAWLTQLACEEKAAWVATGHTADDQAETVIFRLLRGSGVAGLSGVSQARALADGVVLIRPTLTLRRQDLRDYLRQRNIPFRIDSSNEDLQFTRNRLRRELLPLLQEYNPAVVDVLCRLADQAKELGEEIAFQRQKLLADAELPRAGRILVFSIDRMQGTSAYLVREMFRAVWQREGWPMGDMTREHWHRLAEIVAGACPASDFPGGIHARRIGGVMQILSPVHGV